MQSDPVSPIEQAHLLRQQVILAQVRIMELEDAVLSHETHLEELENMLASSQLLVDRQADEVEHLKKAQVAAESQLAHLKHLHHEAHLALADAHKRLESALKSITKLENDRDSLQTQLNDGAVAQQQLEEMLRASQLTATERHSRIEELVTERRTMKGSRSWRWTAWIRDIERWLDRRRS